MKTIICEKNEFASLAADAAAEVLSKKQDAVLALACGQTMEPVWQELARRCGAGELSLRLARVLCVTELCGAAPEKSCRAALERGLLACTDLSPENCHFPDADDPAAYDRLIDSLGGLDLALLGLGEDCHIGYNEPGTLFDTRTHVQKLTGRTKRQLLRRGFAEEDMPQEAVTMGIKTLTEAGSILLLAAGREKAAAVYQMLYAKTTSYIPAAYLQVPLNVTVLLDRDAAAKL